MKIWQSFRRDLSYRLLDTWLIYQIYPRRRLKNGKISSIKFMNKWFGMKRFYKPISFFPILWLIKNAWSFYGLHWVIILGDWKSLKNSSSFIFAYRNPYYDCGLPSWTILIYTWSHDRAALMHLCKSRSATKLNIYKNYPSYG